jgi:hypothetical protein
MVRSANGWSRVALVDLVVAGLSGCASLIAAGPASASGMITQVGQTSGTVYNGSAFTAQLETTGNVGSVSFSTYSPICGLVTVSRTGLISVPAGAHFGDYNLYGHDSCTVTTGIERVAPVPGITACGCRESHPARSSDKAVLVDQAEYGVAPS